MDTNDPFYVSKRNRRGVFILICLLIPIILFPRIYDWVAPSEPLSVSIEEWESKSESIQRNQSQKRTFFKRKKFQNKEKYKIPPSKFDPNQYAIEDWMKLGLSQKQADIVLKFGKYGFYSNEDLRKVFVINDELFALLKDSLIFPEKPQKKYQTETPTKREVVEKIIPELNSANEEELQALKGIGPFFAKQVIKYRDRLGGFHNKSQLMEVWKMNVETFEILEQNCRVNPNSVKKFNLNEVTFEELKLHPYLNWNQANSIIKMRQQRGRYEKIEEIKESKLIDEETFLKVSPYLSL
jgi:competence protein ComEA